MKKILAFTLTVIIIGLMPLSAFAEEIPSANIAEASDLASENLPENENESSHTESDIEGSFESDSASDIESSSENEDSFDFEESSEIPEEISEEMPGEMLESMPIDALELIPIPEPSPTPNSKIKYNNVSDLLETVNHNAYVKGSGGKFNPDKSLTRAEAAQMFYDLLKDKNVGRTNFKDVSSSAWYYNAVTRLAKLGIINGVSKTEFQPNRAITREEFVAIACRFAKMKTGENIFNDVKSTRWSYKSIISAHSNGWLLGYTDGTFRPLNKITKAEAVTVINRMLNRKADKKVKVISIVNRFDDVPTSYWAFAQISEASTTHKYILKSNGNETWIVSENDTITWENTPYGYKAASKFTGTYLSGFQAINGHTYYFDPSTKIMKTSWQKISGKVYYFAVSGTPSAGAEPLGSMSVGLKNWENSKIYFNKKGVLQTGWQKVSGNFYYFATSGALGKLGIAYTGTHSWDNTTYTFSNGGVLQNTDMKIPVLYQGHYPTTPFGNTTVASNGCGLVSTTMALQHLTGKNIAITTIRDIGNKYFDPQHNFVRAKLYDGFFTEVAAKYGIKVKITTNAGEALDAIKMGNPVLSFQQGGNIPSRTTSGHYIVLRAANSKNIIRMNDPNDKARKNHNATSFSFYDEINIACKKYVIFSK
jgi:FOG: Glucan-binding domain (YG repeat)